MPEIIIDQSNFQKEVLESPVPVFIDFWAPWCGPCQMMGPVIEELSNEYDAAKVKVGKLNVDDNPDLAQKYDVLSIPTFLLFKNGAVADQLVGGVPKARVKEFIDKHL